MTTGGDPTTAIHDQNHGSQSNHCSLDLGLLADLDSGLDSDWGVGEHDVWQQPLQTQRYSPSTADHIRPNVAVTSLSSSSLHSANMTPSATSAPPSDAHNGQPPVLGRPQNRVGYTGPISPNHAVRKVNTNSPASAQASASRTVNSAPPTTSSFTALNMATGTSMPISSYTYTSTSTPMHVSMSSAASPASSSYSYPTRTSPAPRPSTAIPSDLSHSLPAHPSIDPYLTIPRPRPAIVRPPTIRKACDLCHVAKQKCSGDRPVCVRCKNSGTACHYPMRQKRKGTLTVKEKEIKEMKELKEMKEIYEELERNQQMTGQDKNSQTPSQQSRGRTQKCSQNRHNSSSTLGNGAALSSPSSIAVATIANEHSLGQSRPLSSVRDASTTSAIGGGSSGGRDAWNASGIQLVGTMSDPPEQVKKRKLNQTTVHAASSSSSASTSASPADNPASNRESNGSASSASVVAKGVNGKIKRAIHNGTQGSTRILMKNKGKEVARNNGLARDTFEPRVVKDGGAVDEDEDPWANLEKHDEMIWRAEEYLQLIDEDGHFEGIDLKAHAKILAPKPLKPPRHVVEPQSQPHILLQPPGLSTGVLQPDSAFDEPPTRTHDLMTENGEIDIDEVAQQLSHHFPDHLFPAPLPSGSPSRSPPRIELDLADFDPSAIFGDALDSHGDISTEALQNALISAQLTSFQLALEQEQQEQQHHGHGQNDADVFAPIPMDPHHHDEFAQFTHVDLHHDHHQDHAQVEMDTSDAAQLRAMMDLASADDDVPMADLDGSQAQAHAQAHIAIDQRSLVTTTPSSMHTPHPDDFVTDQSIPDMVEFTAQDVQPDEELKEIPEPICLHHHHTVMQVLEAYRSLGRSLTLPSLFPHLTTALGIMHDITNCLDCSTNPAWTIPHLALFSRTSTILAERHPLTPSPLNLVIAGGCTINTGLPPEIEVHIVDIVWATWRGATLQKAFTKLQMLAMAELAQMKARKGSESDLEAGADEEGKVARCHAMLQGLARLQKFMGSKL